MTLRPHEKLFIESVRSLLRTTGDDRAHVLAILEDLVTQLKLPPLEEPPEPPPSLATQLEALRHDLAGLRGVVAQLRAQLPPKPDQP